MLYQLIIFLPLFSFLFLSLEKLTNLENQYILFFCTVFEFVMKVFPILIEAGISGFESPAAEYKELQLSLDQLLINHPNATFIGQASGDSMQGIGIFDGDILIVDRSLTVKHGDIIVANYNGGFVCKVLDKSAKLLLSASLSTSKGFAPVSINPEDTFQLEGVVTRSIRLHHKAPELLACLH
jgi:DNA polymerase V